MGFFDNIFTKKAEDKLESEENKELKKALENIKNFINS